MKIKIVRESQNSNSITGSLYVNDKYICRVLERLYNDNKKESSVSAGTYGGAFTRTDGKLGWRIQLEGTAPRTAIQIHRGNKPEHSKGCILPGTEVDTKTNFVSNSVVAREKLKKEWENSALCPKSANTVVIEYKEGFAQCTEPKNNHEQQCTEKNKNQDIEKDNDKNKNEEKRKEEEKKREEASKREEEKKKKEDEIKGKDEEKEKKKAKEEQKKKDEEAELKKKKNNGTTMPRPDDGSDPCPTGHHSEPESVFIWEIPTLEEMEKLVASLNENKGWCGMDVPASTESPFPSEPDECGSTGNKPELPPRPIIFDPDKAPPGGCGIKDPLPPYPRKGSLPFFRGQPNVLEECDGKSNDLLNGRISPPEYK